MSETCPACGYVRDYDAPLLRPGRGQRVCKRCMRPVAGGPHASAPFDPDSPIPLGSHIEWASDEMLAEPRCRIGRLVERRDDVLVLGNDGQRTEVPMAWLFAIYRRDPDLPWP